MGKNARSKVQCADRATEYWRGKFSTHMKNDLKTYEYKWQGGRGAWIELQECSRAKQAHRSRITRSPTLPTTWSDGWNRGLQCLLSQCDPVHKGSVYRSWPCAISCYGTKKTFHIWGWWKKNLHVSWHAHREVVVVDAGNYRNCCNYELTTRCTHMTHDLGGVWKSQAWSHHHPHHPLHRQDPTYVILQ